MKIYTSYYSNARNLNDCILISISRATPIVVDYFIEELAPSWIMLNKYKNGGSEEEYIKEYNETILGSTSTSHIIGLVRRIMMKDKRKKVVLLCYEGKGKFCHRHLVSHWFRQDGYTVEEI